MTNNALYYCEHQYGSGKTSAWLDHCATRARLRNQCIVYPTRALLREKLALFRAMGEQRASGLRISAITSDTSGSVINDLVAFFNGSGTGEGRVLFMTHQAWLELPHLHHAEEWEFCFDDCAITPFVDVSLDLADQHQLLTSVLEPADPSAAHSPLRVREGRAGRLQEMAANRDGDAVLEVVARVARAMARPDGWAGVWCNVENWRRVLAGAVRGESEEDRAKRRTLFLQAEINPRRFTSTARTTFLRTRWTGTLMHLNTVRNHGIRFEAHPDVRPAGRPYLGRGLRILHYQEPIFSKHNRDQPVANGPTRFEQFQRHIEAIHDGRRYGVVMNNDKRRAGVEFRGADAIPPECAGQEGFAELTSIAAPIALRHSSAMMGFLHDRGITSQEANDDLYAEGIAQIIMRSAARRQGFAGEITAHVMDAWVAGRLLERFPLATAEHVPGVVTPLARERRSDGAQPGRPRQHASGAARTAACRARQRARQLAAQQAAA
jgi:hypothetical protein